MCTDGRRTGNSLRCPEDGEEESDVEQPHVMSGDGSAVAMDTVCWFYSDVRSTVNMSAVSVCVEVKNVFVQSANQVCGWC